MEDKTLKNAAQEIADDDLGNVTGGWSDGQDGSRRKLVTLYGWCCQTMTCGDYEAPSYELSTDLPRVCPSCGGPIRITTKLGYVDND